MSRPHSEDGFIFSAHFCKSTVPLRVISAAQICFRRRSTSVGYASQDLSNKKYNAVGFCFANVNADGVATLGDVTATGWNYENDELRLLNPANSVSTMKFLWLTAAEAEELEVGNKAGWYDDEDYEYQNLREFDLGSGFLTSLGSKGVSFTYSGQVYDQAFTIDCSGRKYNVIPNALPRDITLGEISVTGWNYENDELRLLNPANSVSTMKFLWLTAAEAAELEVGDKAGWYDDEDYQYQANFSVTPACGFLTSLGSKSVKINLPAAINTL